VQFFNPRARTVTTGERIPSQDTYHPSSPPRSPLLRRNSGIHVAHICRAGTRDLDNCPVVGRSPTDVPGAGDDRVEPIVGVAMGLHDATFRKLDPVHVRPRFLAASDYLCNPQSRRTGIRLPIRLLRRQCQTDFRGLSRCNRGGAQPLVRMSGGGVASTGHQRTPGHETRGHHDRVWNDNRG